MRKVAKSFLLGRNDSSSFETLLCGKRYVFRAKPGLFSKDRIDSGSRLLIESAEIHTSDIALDLGCGYGAIGLTVAKKADRGRVFMVDNDIRAINFAKINAELNQIKNAEIRISDGFQNLAGVDFDIILSNPPSHISNQLLEEFIAGSYEHLKMRGKLYLVNEHRISPLIKKIVSYYFGNYQMIKSGEQHKVSLAVKK